MSLRLAALLFALAPCALACRAATPPAEPAAAVAGATAADERAIRALLDDWHQAASRADGARYFGHMAEDAVFLGTDASERWSLAAFRAYCEPYFSKGIGWTYEPRERHVLVHGDVAWFDERLWNDKYGECRGTGALRRDGGAWKLVHYSLTMPIPNELAADVVKMIRGG
jgi:ketosteroid isomerase-like protein